MQARVAGCARRKQLPSRSCGLSGKVWFSHSWLRYITFVRASLSMALSDAASKSAVMNASFQKVAIGGNSASKQNQGKPRTIVLLGQRSDEFSCSLQKLHVDELDSLEE